MNEVTLLELLLYELLVLEMPPDKAYRLSRMQVDVETMEASE